MMGNIINIIFLNILLLTYPSELSDIMIIENPITNVKNLYFEY